jgi:hypothetical protein
VVVLAHAAPETASADPHDDVVDTPDRRQLRTERTSATLPNTNSKNIDVNTAQAELVAVAEGAPRQIIWFNESRSGSLLADHDQMSEKTFENCTCWKL